MGHDERLRDAFLKLDDRIADVRSKVRATPIAALPPEPITTELLRKFAALLNMWKTLLEAYQGGNQKRIDDALSEVEALQ